MVAATEYSVDTSLNAAKFAAQAMASTVTSRRLLWLRPFGRTLDPVGPTLIDLTPKGLTGHPIDRPFGTGVDITLPQGDCTGVRDPGPLSETSDSLSPLPIGGRLGHFIHQWEVTTSEAWILRMVGLGLTLEFSANPPDRFIPCPVSRQLVKRQQLAMEIQICWI